MAPRGKPRTKESASGRHDYSSKDSLSYWQQRWRAEFDALPEQKRREQIAHVRFLLPNSPRGSSLRQYAAACGITEDGDGDDGSTEKPTGSEPRHALQA